MKHGRKTEHGHAYQVPTLSSDKRAMRKVVHMLNGSEAFVNIHEQCRENPHAFQKSAPVSVHNLENPSSYRNYCMEHCHFLRLACASRVAAADHRYTTPSRLHFPMRHFAPLGVTQTRNLTRTSLPYPRGMLHSVECGLHLLNTQ